MEAVVDEKLGLRKNSLKVVRLLEKIIIISSHISMMSDESYNCHLTLIEQITFNVRIFLVFLLNLVLRVSFLTLVFSRFSWCASISRDAGWLRRTWLLAHVIKKKKIVRSLQQNVHPCPNILSPVCYKHMVCLTWLLYWV